MARSLRMLLSIVWLIAPGTFALAVASSASQATAAELTPRDDTNDEVVKEESPTEKTPAKPAPRVVDKKLEREVLEMVDNHLPDIKVLLDQLRQKAPRQYDMAIRNLAKSARRLQTAKKRGEEAFELELQLIQAQSSINLLIAKLKVRDNKRDRDALMEATKKAELAEIAKSTHELATLQARLDRLKEQVAAAEKRLSQQTAELDDNIEKDFQTYLRKSGRK